MSENTLSPTLGVAMVVARPGALDAAIDKARTSLRALQETTDVSRSTIGNVAGKPGYGIAKDKAARIADALGVPIGDLFVHRDGAPLT